VQAGRPEPRIKFTGIEGDVGKIMREHGQAGEGIDRGPGTGRVARQRLLGKQQQLVRLFTVHGLPQSIRRKADHAVATA
jgi:hypothetical protein